MSSGRLTYVGHKRTLAPVSNRPVEKIHESPQGLFNHSLIFLVTMYIYSSSRQLYTHITQALAAIYEPEEARSIAFLLIESKFGLSRTNILMDKPIETPAPSLVDEWIRRLQSQEPVQYILGEAAFYGRQWHVTPAVLIPRPETEELVQWVLDTVQASKQTSVRILDIGTGSGCIATTLACELPFAEVWAVDISEQALAVAQANAWQWKAMVQFRQWDFLSTTDCPADLPERFDILVSNPPYITTTEQAAMHANVLQHEPHTALFVPDTDPLIFYRHIAHFCQQRLQPRGSVFVEINEYLAEETLQLFHCQGFSAKVRKDLFGKNRMIGGHFAPISYVS